jgi:hypothetical protein
MMTPMKNAAVSTLMLLSAMAALTACDTQAFDDSFKTSFRKSFVDNCVAAAQKSSGSQNDFSPICGCVADKLIQQSANAKELVTNSASDEKNAEAVRQCRK